jgi:predicted nucleotidyltransferase
MNLFGDPAICIKDLCPEKYSFVQESGQSFKDLDDDKMRLVQELLGSKPKIQILETIADSTDAYTVRDLARLVGLPKSTVAILVQEWEKIGLLETRFVGRAKTIKIKSDYPLLPLVRQLFKEQHTYMDKIIETIRNDPLLKSSDVKTVILYGSLARKNIGGTSDADLLVVTEHELPENHVAHQAWDRLHPKLPLLPSIAFMTKNDIKKRIETKDPYIINIFHDGKPLKGGDWFDSTKQSLRSR